MRAWARESVSLTVYTTGGWVAAAPVCGCCLGGGEMGGRGNGVSFGMVDWRPWGGMMVRGGGGGGGVR